MGRARYRGLAGYLRAGRSPVRVSSVAIIVVVCGEAHCVLGASCLFFLILISESLNPSSGETHVCPADRNATDATLLSHR